MAESLVSIPLSNLVPSSANVRKTAADTGIEELVALIAAQGLLQNLTVRRVTKPNGKPSGKYEVVAGGRRLRALTILVERQQLPSNTAVPCLVIDNHDPVEVSLAENVGRAPLHPADQFEAFAKLKAEGLSAEDIAARFGVEPGVVIRRLKLAAVSPVLMQAYRDGDLTLEQLMAFTVSDDHELQNSVWSSLPHHDREPRTIKRALTRNHVRGTDRRAQFIGAEAYEAAGGVIVRDLFDADDDGYFADSMLLDRLVSERLQAEAEKIRAEGWSWIEVMPEMDYGYLARFRRVQPNPVALSTDEQTRADEIAARYDALVENIDDEPSPEVSAEIDRLSAAIDAIDDNRLTWTPEEKAAAGAILCLGLSGDLVVERGLIKPGDKPMRPQTGETQTEETGEARESTKPAYTEALLERLSAHRTAALRESVAARPPAALVAILHALALPVLYGDHHDSCVDVRARSASLSSSASDIGASRAAIALETRRKAWMQRLPPADGLWEWCAAQDLETQLELLAFCTAMTIDAVRKRFDGGSVERVAHSDALASLVSLDMTEWWEATGTSYLSDVSKAQIVAAVAEAVSRDAAESIRNLKKDAMIAKAEQLLAGRRWLPEPLRRPMPTGANTDGRAEA